MTWRAFSGLFAVFLVSPAFAHPGGHEGEYARPVAPPQQPTSIPESLPGVLSSLRERLSAASTALAAGKVADLNRACTQISDLVAAVPAKATGLKPDTKAKVAEATSRLSTAVEAIRQAGRNAEASSGQTAIDAMRSELDALDVLILAG